MAVPEEEDRLMWRRLFSLVRKELRQLLRDWPILFILAWAFSGAIYVAGHAARIEISDYPLVVYDLSRSPTSRELVSRLRPPYFKLVGFAHSDQAVVRILDSGGASVAVVIPPDFERLVAEGDGRFQIIADGTITQSSILATGYIAQIAAQLNLELFLARLDLGPDEMERLPRIDARQRVAFNPNVENSWFTSLLEVLNITTMVSTLLTAAAMVREKAYGTLEQLMVSPLRPMELFVAKIIPTVAIVVLLSTVSLFGIVRDVFHTPIRGSLPLFYAVTAVYVSCVSSMGLLIAVFARNLAQAMMMLFLILMPMMFLSGAFTPPESMSPWMRYASLVSPMRYFMDFGYQVLFKGNGLAFVWRDIVGILALGSAMFGLSMWGFRRLYR
jgi:ABC-2 type transport system permease protein